LNSDLRDRDWRIGYSSDEVDLLSEFYMPAMTCAKSYDRAVGYFSSRSLALVAKGIRELYLRNGRMRLIASPVLSPEDIEAIRLGHAPAAERLEMRLLEFLDPERLNVEEAARLQLLTGMLSDGLLELKLAVRQLGDGEMSLYHEKVGIFTDAKGDFITFIGSPNESWNGWVGNAESFALHTSWGPASDYARHERLLFLRTWEGQRPGVPVRDFPAAVRDALFKRFPAAEPEKSGGARRRSSHVKTPAIPETLLRSDGLREYQRVAVNRWLEANGRGVFAMATGTGKTVTALVAAVRLSQALTRSRRSLLVLVTVPSQDLVRQWEEAAFRFGFQPVCCHGETGDRWPAEFDTALQRLRYAGPAIEMVITTADTMITGRFRQPLERYPGDVLLVADEMHSLGTPRRLSALPSAQFRLGLSATPRRHGDEEGTEGLLSYFGRVVQRIDIRDAIALKALVPYTYTPVIVALADDEMAAYRTLSARIAAAIGAGGASEDAFDGVKHLLLERSRLIGHASAKLAALGEVMAPIASSNFNLVYVAEGTHPVRGTSQIDDAVALLGGRMGMRLNRYTSETPAQDRATYQAMLRDGRLQALVAMRCLDEGIDIPEARRGVVMASTQNPRQFVQRRGRILRLDHGSGKTHAELIDLLVIPEDPPSKSDPAFRLERRLVGRELTRALELSSASRNGRDVPPAALGTAMERYELWELLAGYSEPPTWENGGDSVY
jgi:superfamily II DNA or RNA helicase